MVLHYAELNATYKMKLSNKVSLKNNGSFMLLC